MEANLSQGKSAPVGSFSASDFAGLTSAEFLALLARNDIDVQVREGRLAVSAPAGRVDERLRAELGVRKADLLTILASPKDPSPRPPLLAGNRAGRIPLTPSQQGFWLIDHFDPGNVAYSIPEAFVLSVPVNLATLQKTVDLLIARHEVLRTGFHEEEGEIYQSIEPEAHTRVESTDLTGLPEEEAADRCRALIREHARRPFDLRRPPLLRVHVFRAASGRDVLFLNIHHILADLQAVHVLREELAEAYAALAANTTPALPTLSLHYADYALWAAEQLRSPRIERQIEYWRWKLDGMPRFLALPYSHPYPDRRNMQGDTVAFELPASLHASLVQMGRDCGATSFMTFMGAFALLIARISGQRDFCIGSPFTQRIHAETQRMIGLFMNMVPFRVQVSVEDSFRDLLRQVRTTALEAYEHSDVPFQTLVRALRFNRTSPRTPIFQVMFGFEQAAQSGFVGRQIDTRPGIARYDLSLVLTESASGILSGYLEYRTDLFERADVEVMARQFVDLAGEVAGTPNRPCLPAAAGVIA